MEINKLIKHIEIIAIDVDSREEFNDLHVFHGKLIEMKLNGIKYFT